MIWIDIYFETTRAIGSLLSERRLVPRNLLLLRHERKIASS